MNRRRGSLALPLLLLLASLLSLCGSFLYWMGRSRESLDHYKRGLRSVYAAESGANWALASVKREKPGEEAILFTVDDHTVTVKRKENSGKGTISSTAVDSHGEYKRYVHISYTLVEENGKRTLRVEEIHSDRT